MSPRPSTDEEVVAALLEADDLLAAGKSLAEIAERFNVREETFRRWQTDYAELVAEERARRSEQSADTAAWDATTQQATLLLAGVMVVIVATTAVRCIFFAAEPIRAIVLGVLSVAAAGAAFYPLQRGEFRYAGRGGRSHVVRRHSNPGLYWFLFWLFGVVVPLGVMAVSFTLVAL